MTLRIGKRNSTYQTLDALKRNRVKRRQMGQFIVEGVAPIDTLVSAGWSIDAFVYDAERRLSPWARGHLDLHPGADRYELSPALMRELSDRDETSEVIVVARMRETRLADLPSDFRLIVWLDRPSSPGNTGSIFRSADAFGIDGIVISGHAVDPFDTRVIRSSIGAVFTVPFVTAVSNDELSHWFGDVRAREKGLRIIGTSAHGSIDLDRVETAPADVLILGNETHGMSRFATGMCDVVARIPIGGSVSSLNVACAATVAMYQLNATRRTD